MVLLGGCVVPLVADVAMKAVNTVANAASEAAHEGADTQPVSVTTKARTPEKTGAQTDDQFAEKETDVSPYPALHRPPTRRYAEPQGSSALATP
jgi:hypothetical protein